METVRWILIWGFCGWILSVTSLSSELSPRWFVKCTLLTGKTGFYNWLPPSTPHLIIYPRDSILYLGINGKNQERQRCYYSCICSRVCADRLLLFMHCKPLPPVFPISTQNSDRDRICILDTFFCLTGYVFCEILTEFCKTHSSDRLTL